jgi:hypothetical protein
VFDKELLIVDDTRLLGDRPLPSGCTAPPKLVWPTAAELDTYFFARGGKPWRCYSTTVPSPVGLFQGYDFDTLGTRFLPNGTLTLERLSHYRHIVWYTDHKASLNVNEPYITQDPMSLLRWYSVPGKSNPLGTWVTQGGELWMFGGGTASALQASWEKTGTPNDVFSNNDGELVPGRFMYDVFGWHSEITARSYVQATKPQHPIGRYPDSPDYSALPDYLFEKSADSDALATWAPGRSFSDFFQSSQVGEGISKPNEVLEDADPDPKVTRLESVVDTVYESVGGLLGTGRPVMTVMHARKPGARQVFSGFQLWYWQRSEQVAITDWVLQTLWGIPRQPVQR